MSFLIVLSSSFVSTVSTSHLILSCFLFYLLTCLISLFSLVFMFHLLLTCCFTCVFFVFACLVAPPLSGLFSFSVFMVLSHLICFLISSLLSLSFTSFLISSFSSQLSFVSTHYLLIFTSHLVSAFLTYLLFLFSRLVSCCFSQIFIFSLLCLFCHEGSFCSLLF